MRIKSKWHKKDRPKSIEEQASVLGFITWRIANERANKMYTAGFNFTSQTQLLAVVGEFAIFLLQLVDRIVHGRMPDEERLPLMGALAQHLIRTMVDNLTEDFGPADYRTGFVSTINQRFDDYAEFGFTDGDPSYQALRYLGQCIDAVAGGEANKWVIEQVIDIEAPEAIKSLKKGLADVLADMEAWAPAT
ncbi:MAG: hypothetical protein WCX90_06730 [Thiohalomonadaceae bacterium]